MNRAAETASGRFVVSPTLKSASRRADSLRFFSHVVGTGVMLEGILVLVGWALDISALKSVLPGLATMKANTAAAFVVAGLFIREDAIRGGTAGARHWHRLCALLVAFVGLLTLIENLSSVDLGIDQLLFKDSAAARGMSHAGRMAPFTAASLLFLGLAMWLSREKGRFAERLSELLAVLVAFIALIASIGYFYGVQSLYRVSGYSSMAVHTALTLLLLSFCVLACHPERGLGSIIASDGPGGRAARQLLPVAVLLPFILGWLRLLGERAGLYDTAFGLSALVLALIAIFSAVIVWNARPLDRLESERRTAEETTREKGRLLQLILDRMSDGVVVADPRGRFLLFNRAAEEVLGMGAADVAPEQWSEHYGVFRGDAKTPCPSSDLPLARAIRGETINDVEIVVRHTLRPEGVWLSVSGGPLQDPEGVLQGGMVLLTDMTERRRFDEARRRAQQLEETARRAEEASRLKSEFLSNMSHELRTPLNAVIGFSELLHDAKVGPVTAEQKEFLGDILTSSRHLLQLINDVLDLSKVEAGKMEFRFERVDMHRLVPEVRDLLRTTANAKRIRVDVEIATGLGHVVVDPGKFKQVLYNYLSNAVKFTPEDGRVTVRVGPEGADSIRLEVEDSGIGIQPEDMGRLFMRFEQLDASASKKQPGTGLGLALTKRLVEAQGGQVGVRSVPGVGSVFHAVLPLAAQPSPAPTLLDPGVAGPVTGLRILVVEDDASDRHLLEQILSAGGYTVETAPTGAAALELLRARPFAGITLDLDLPDLSGIDVLTLLRADGPNRGTPVIVVTGASPVGIPAGIQVHEILQKPPDEGSLLAAFDRAGLRRDRSRPVLVVDDDPRALKFAETELRSKGYRVLCRRDGVSALQTVEEQRPAAIILDLTMEGMDGREFLAKLRERPHGRNVPVIIWTLKDLSADERCTLLARAQALVLKDEGSKQLLDHLSYYVTASRPEGGEATSGR